MTSIPQNISRDRITKICTQLGLHFLGTVRLEVESDFQNFKQWISLKKHAGMHFLEKNHELREDPRLLLEGVQTAVVFGLPYYRGDRINDKGPPKIAQYARMTDYHKQIWKSGEYLMDRIHQECVGEQFGRVVVDSAPILERAMAKRTGGGFIGKNTCFISPKEGSFFLLGEVLTTALLPVSDYIAIDPKKRTKDGGCGSCKRCQVHCPTGALDKDYQLDANRCLAYWTIEHRGLIPERFWPYLKTYWFGCDICQLVCPYNRGIKKAQIKDNQKRSFPDVFDVAVMNQKEYEKYFGGTPLTRAKISGLRRNALIALAVTSDLRLQKAISCVASDDKETLTGTVDQIKKWVAKRNGAQDWT